MTSIDRLKMLSNGNPRTFSEIYPAHAGSDSPQQDRERAYQNDLRAVTEQHEELLVALQGMMRLESSIDQSAWYASSECPDAFRTARAAITKATGT